MQDYSVDLPTGKDLMVLDVMELLKAQDPSLTYRRSCREGVCGSDGVNMNGKNGLACITPVSEVAKKDKLVLRPLPGLPVIRDLVVDMSQFYRQYEKIQPIRASTINRRRRKNGCSRRKTARSSTDCTSASCARVVRRRARRSGGTPRSSSVLQGCFRHIGSSPIAATLQPQNVWPNSTIRSAFSAAAAS